MKTFCHGKERKNIFIKRIILSLFIDMNERLYFMKSNQDLLLHNFLGLNNKQEW